MDEEDRLGETLATLYRNGRERMAGLDDAKQREFIESQFAQGDLVYAVWLDASKPHGIDCEVLKGGERQPTITTMTVVPCNDRGHAGQYQRMLGIN
jgi:hypothetical protein